MWVDASTLEQPPKPTINDHGYGILVYKLKPYKFEVGSDPLVYEEWLRKWKI